MMRIFAFILVSAGIFGKASAQTTAGSLPPSSEASAPAASLREAFQKGQFQGNFRSFLMATDNARHLSDYHAWAAGGFLHFQTKGWHGFQMGLGGSFHFNLASSDFTQKDSSTGAVNRYEIGLFDVENPANRNDLDRLEEWWLRYNLKNTYLQLGRQILQTPFINYQDGRMRPTAEEGLWVSSRALRKTQIEGGWLWRISPRSTVKWYQAGASIGLYPKGLNPNGGASGYPENLSSKGIGLLGVTRPLGKNGKIQLWNQLVEGIFNTAFVQTDWEWPAQRHTWIWGVQALHQNALAAGGNEDPAKSYFPKNGVSNAFSTQFGWKKGRWTALGAYTHVTADGRFLSPREWGREPFYTFMSRERMEGSGNAHAGTVRLIWQNNAKNWRIEAAYGQFFLPDVKNAALNKYAFPSFRQTNLDARYVFKGPLEGLRAQFLLVWKGRMGAVYGNDRYVINKVDMWHYNLILNYQF